VPQFSCRQSVDGLLISCRGFVFTFGMSFSGVPILQVCYFPRPRKSAQDQHLLQAIASLRVK